MKLSDIKDISYLLESFDLSYEYTQIENTSKQDVYRIEETKTTIYFVFDTYKKLNLIDISFMDDDSKHSLTKSKTPKEVLKIFGTIFKLIKLHSNIHIWYFSAKRDTDVKEHDFNKRVEFYTRLANRMSRDMNCVLTTRKLRGDYIYILSSAEIQTKDIIDYILAKNHE